MRGIVEGQMIISIEPLMYQTNTGSDGSSQCKHYGINTVDFCVSCDILHIEIRSLLSK